MDLFFCSNDILTFQNKDQRKQTIEEFHITRNNKWLPYNIDYDDRLENVIEKLGQPDLFRNGPKTRGWNGLTGRSEEHELICTASAPTTRFLPGDSAACLPNGTWWGLT